MTNEELDIARCNEAHRLFFDKDNKKPSILIAAQLAREGWMPPVAVDPDWKEADLLYESHDDHNDMLIDLAFAGIKRGRALAAAEVKSRLIMTTIGKGVTVEHYADGTSKDVQSEDAV